MNSGILETDLDEGECREFVLNDAQFFALRYDNELYVYRNRCPHLGVELNWQENRFLDPDGVLIQCATHGALFQVHDGKCVSGPCLGQHLSSVDFSIEAGEIVIIQSVD